MIPAIERFEELRWDQSHDPSAGIEVAFNTSRQVLDSQPLRHAILKSWDPISLIDSVTMASRSSALGRHPTIQRG